MDSTTLSWLIPTLTALAAVAGNLIQFVSKNKDQDQSYRKQTFEELRGVILELRSANTDLSDRLSRMTDERDFACLEVDDLKKKLGRQ